MTPFPDTVTTPTGGECRIFDRATAGLLVSDLDGTITAINTAMERLLGMVPGAGRGTNFLALLDPPDQMCDLMESLLTGGASQERVISVAIGERPQRLVLSAVLLPSPDVAVHQEFLVTARPADAVPDADVSDNAVVIAASARLGGLVAHDLNNALSVIVGACHLLGAPGADATAFRRDLELLTAASLEASLIVRQLATYGASRPSAPVPIQPVVELRRLAPVVSRLLGSALDLRVTDEAADGVLVSDPDVFDDVVMTLALEARRTMRPGDRLGVQVAPSPSGDAWCVCLRIVAPCAPDPGRLVEVGGGTDDRTRPVSLARLAVQRWLAPHGGRLQIADAGTRFTAEVTWPRTAHRRQPQPTLPPAAISPSTRVVLLVDDNVPLRQFMARVLESSGYEVVAVGSAADALEALETRRFDAVLTDICMPEISGWEVGKAVRRRDPGCGVVYVTGELVDGEGIDARGGADCLVLLKPFTAPLLLDTVARACAHRQAA